MECEGESASSVMAYTLGRSPNPLCFFVTVADGYNHGGMFNAETPDEPNARLLPKFMNRNLVLVDKDSFNVSDWRNMIYTSQLCDQSTWSAQEHIGGCACRYISVPVDAAHFSVNQTMSQYLGCCCESELISVNVIDQISLHVNPVLPGWEYYEEKEDSEE